MLFTKLHLPTPSKNLVHRPGLSDKLQEALDCKLLLVSAPAGFGKTTLICDWIDQNDIPTAWFSLDKGDNDPVKFLSYIISSIQHISKEAGLNALKVLKSSNKPSLESITSLLINDILNIDENFLLVLDDFHTIDSQEILNLVSYLLEHIPRNIHLVIITRSDPSLPLARLRSQGQLLELRSADLSFSVNDIYTLFNKKLKIKLSNEDVYSLETKTEGWIAGLQLTALSLRGREDISGFIQDFEGDNRYIMDYLIEEVLKNQHDDIKEFLIHTSVLEQISAPLCDRILNRNDSQLILEKLVRNNMFIVPLDTKGKWYRYHQLFRDLLQKSLLLKDKSTIKELHTEACNRYEENKLYDFAIEHSLEIKDFKRSIEILDSIVVALWENGQHAAIMKYGELIPLDLTIKYPGFSLYYSWILITAIQIKQAEPYLVNAEKTTRKIINDKSLSNKEHLYYRHLLGKISVAFAYLNSHKQHSQGIFDYCERAMNFLSEDDPLWVSWAWFAYGIAHFSKGDIHESNRAFSNALKYGKKSGNVFLISTIAIRMAENEQQLGHFKSAYKRCTDLLGLMKESEYLQLSKAEWTYAGLYSILALTEYMRLDVDDASVNIKIAYDLSKKAKDIPIKINILMVYSAVLLEQGDKTAAGRKINELELIIQQNEVSPFLRYAYVTWKAYLLLDMDQLDRANDLFEAYGFAYDKEKTHINELAYICYARLLIAQNKLDEVEVVLSELQELAESGKRTERLIELKVLYAILDEMLGNHDQAIVRLIEAMEYSAVENLFIYFVFKNDYLHDLLLEVFKIHATINNNIPKTFIDKLKSALEKKERLKKVHTESEISSREMDTLRLIAKGLSNQEIADLLFISLHTVKSHVQNILLKLDVDKRSKAVIKAKELDII